MYEAPDHHFSMTFKIENGMLHNIVLRQRGGINIVIPANKDKPRYYPKAIFVVHIQLTDPENVNFDSDGIVSPLDKEIVEQAKAKLAEFVENDSKRYYHTRDFYIYIELDKRHTDETNCYIKSDIFGFQLSMEDINSSKQIKEFIGPTKSGSVNKMKKKLFKETGNEPLTFSLKIVDRKKVLPDFWVSIFGKTFIVDRCDEDELDEEIIDGVYIFHHNGLKQISSMHIGLEEASIEKLNSYGLYLDKYSAIANKNCKFLQDLQSKVRKLQEELSNTIKSSERKDYELYSLKEEINYQKKEIKAIERQHKFNLDVLKNKFDNYKSKADSNKGSDLFKNFLSLGGFVLTVYKTFM